MAINPNDSFVSPSSAEILDVLGAEVYFLLSDSPWSFRVVAGSGERVGLWFSESPVTVTVTVQVENDGGLLFTSEKDGATRLSVSRSAPEIVCEFADGLTVGRLAITLFPQLRIVEKTAGASFNRGVPFLHDDQ